MPSPHPHRNTQLSPSFSFHHVTTIHIDQPDTFHDSLDPEGSWQATNIILYDAHGGSFEIGVFGNRGRDLQIVIGPSSPEDFPPILNASSPTTTNPSED